MLENMVDRTEFERREWNLILNESYDYALGMFGYDYFGRSKFSLFFPPQKAVS